MRPWPLLELLDVGLDAPAALLRDLDELYDGLLAVPPGSRPRFAAGEGEPVYHFALLVPGDRFGPALAWARERVQLLPGPDGDVVFDFTAWDALACYFHDPAGNIAELIAHRGLGENGRNGAFEPGELLGLSELALVGDPPAMERALAETLDLRLWDGTADEPGRLAFVGERGRTLILSPPGRGWLPTGRPAAPHAVDVLLSGPPEGELLLEGMHRVRRRAV